MESLVTPRGVSRLRSREWAYGGLILAMFGWGGAFIAGKLVLRELSATTAAGWRFALAAVVVLPFAARHLRQSSLRAVFVPLAVMMLCGGLLYPWLFMASLERTAATNTSLIIAVMPVLTLMLCPLIGEAVPLHRWAAVVLALLGAAVVIARGDPAALTNLGTLNLGDLLALCAAAVWAVFNLASRRVVVDLPPTLVNAAVFSVGAVALLLLSLPEHPVDQLAAVSGTGWVGLLYLGLIPSVLSGYLYLHAMSVLGVSRIVVFIYGVPFVTAALAALVLGDTLNWYQAFGGGLIFAGLLLALDRSVVAD